MNSQNMARATGSEVVQYAMNEGMVASVTPAASSQTTRRGEGLEIARGANDDYALFLGAGSADDFARWLGENHVDYLVVKTSPALSGADYSDCPNNPQCRQSLAAAEKVFANSDYQVFKLRK